MNEYNNQNVGSEPGRDNSYVYGGVAREIRVNPITTGEWLGVYVLQAIPVVNVIMLFVWALGNANENKKNYAKAFITMYGIIFLLGIILQMIQII